MTSDPLKISQRPPIPSKDFRSSQNFPKTPNPLKRLPIPSKSSKPGGAIAIATTNDHEPPTPPLLPFRTSHPPYNTHATQHAIPRGQESRCSGPKSPVRDRPGSGIRFLGFAQLTTSRSRLARARHASPPTAVQRHTRILWRHRIPVPRPNAERRSLARVPEPTPQGRLRPITPRFAKNASLEASLQKNRHNNFITPR